MEAVEVVDGVLSVFQVLFWLPRVVAWVLVTLPLHLEQQHLARIVSYAAGLRQSVARA